MGRTSRTTWKTEAQRLCAVAQSLRASCFPSFLTNTLMSQAMIDQRRRDRATDLPKFSPFLKILSAATLDTLKPLYLLLCPPLVDAFILQEMKWGKNPYTQNSLLPDTWQPPSKSLTSNHIDTIPTLSIEWYCPMDTRIN